MSNWIIIALFVVTALATVIIIILENRQPVRALAWVVTVCALPGLGLLLYAVFGRNVRRRMISRKTRRHLNRRENAPTVKLDDLPLTSRSKLQIRLTKILGGTPFYTGNDVKIFNNGHDKFNALIADLRNAQKFINIEYYIFEDDNVGRQVFDILIEKASAGVEVRMIYDHLGSWSLPKRLLRKLESAGVACAVFNKVGFNNLVINWRNHRKICVIDGTVGYIGGMNVADRYIDGGKTFNMWRDLHLRVTGPIVASLDYAFAVDWSYVGMPGIDTFVDSRDIAPTGDIGMQLLCSGPLSRWNNLATLFLKAISQARNRVFIVTPYFLPTEALLRALQTAGLAGVDVRIMLPRRSDSMMLTYASFSYLKECMQANIKFYLFEPGMVHSKALIVDDEFVSVGSTNFDFRSFEHNFEANMQIYSREINTEMAELFFLDLRRSTRVEADAWRRRPYWRRILESLTRLLAPIL